MLYDADIRDGLCLFLDEKYGKVRFLEELRLGNSRADMVMVTEAGLVGIEIKSDADSYARLPRQIRDYDTYCDGSILVIGSTHAAHAAEHIPAHWGILVVNREGSGLDFYELRQAKHDGGSKLKKQIRKLWRRELAHIQKKNGLYAYKGKRRSFIEKYILDSIPPEKLKSDLIEELFERDYTVFTK